MSVVQISIQERAFRLNMWSRDFISGARSVEEFGSFSVCGEEPEPKYKYIFPDGKIVTEQLVSPNPTGPGAIIGLVDDDGNIILDSVQWP